MQEESQDDGGSQSGLGIMHVHSTPPTRVDFDVRDGAVLTVPATRFTVSVRNLNEPGQPLLKVSTFGRRHHAKRARRKEVTGGAQQSSSGCSCPGSTLVTCRPNPP